MLIKNNIEWGEFLRRDLLKPFQWKIKTYNAELNQKLQRTILKRGWDAPIYVRYNNEDYLILDGHQRLLALTALAEKGYMLENDMIPVVRIIADSEKEAKEKVLEYNSRYAEWNLDELSLRVDELDLEDINLWPEVIINLDPIEYNEETEDEVPALVEDPIVEVGDIFQLGNHRLICGDSTSEEVLNQLMDHNKANLVRTDPPYNVDYHGSGKDTNNKIQNDNLSNESFYNLLNDAFKNLQGRITGEAGIYVRHNWKNQDVFNKTLTNNGVTLKQQLVRNKPSLGLGGGEYRPKHELCFYGGAKGMQTAFYGDRSNSTVIDLWKEKTDKQILNMIKASRKAEQEGKTTILSIKRDNVQEYSHPTQKPVELCELSILNSTKRDDIILDLFAWSGVCIITAEKHNRRAFAVELDPKYVQVILKRYNTYTHKIRPITCLNREIDFSQIFK